jgi:hypothetical protein
MILSVDPADTRELSLRVCERGKLDACVSYSGNPYYEPLGPSALSFVLKGKYYYVTLPKGRYEATFLDSEGNRAWPTFVEESYIDPLCDDSLKPGSVWLPEPPATGDECASLLQNGDAEGSEEHHSHWIAGPGGIDVLANQGIGINPSRAFCDISLNLALSNSRAYSIGQYVDTRCLVENRVYKVEALVRLVDRITNTSVSMKCPGASTCPKIGFFFVSNDGFSWFHEVNNSDNIFDIFVVRRGMRRRSDDLNGYEPVEGKLLVDAEIASAASAFLYIYRNNKDEDVLFCVDDVSLTLNTESF